MRYDKEEGFLGQKICEIEKLNIGPTCLAKRIKNFMATFFDFYLLEAYIFSLVCENNDSTYELK